MNEKIIQMILGKIDSLQIHEKLECYTSSFILNFSSPGLSNFISLFGVIVQGHKARSPIK